MSALWEHSRSCWEHSRSLWANGAYSCGEHLLRWGGGCLNTHVFEFLQCATVRKELLQLITSEAYNPDG